MEGDKLMDTKRLRTGILFLDRDRLNIYLPDKKTIITFEFKPEIVRDLEILNREQFYLELKSFIENNKLSPCSLIIILSKNTLFEKDFVAGQGSEEEQKIQAQQFIESVPFEPVASKSIISDKGFRVIVSNEDLFETVSAVFKEIGFTVSVVLPVSLFGDNITTLNTDSIRVFYQRADSVKKYSLASIDANLLQTKEATIKKQKNYYMIALAVGMLTVAIFLIIYAVFFLK